ncbi:MAG: hypothetical protein Q9M23_08670, partial [Mariprofundaceae bacterium]|nr:hypothetical protein [Mariprofundaceae bacterium]
MEGKPVGQEGEGLVYEVKIAKRPKFVFCLLDFIDKILMGFLMLPGYFFFRHVLKPYGFLVFEMINRIIRQ